MFTTIKEVIKHCAIIWKLFLMGITIAAIPTPSTSPLILDKYNSTTVTSILHSSAAPTQGGHKAAQYDQNPKTPPSPLSHSSLYFRQPQET
jgi:hypothetical protein